MNYCTESVLDDTFAAVTTFFLFVPHFH